MDQAKKEEMDLKWKQIATQAVTQKDFKEKLVRDPLAVMKEFGLETPDQVKVNQAVDKTIRLILPSEASDELQEEAKWWQWRLNTIKEFGREMKTGVQHAAPEMEDGI